ncbi:unnamed protein product [Clonostachys solani]|uniref:C2H2-type domain-containing protein n=1 Tax=Clonostachys solani TaxID=160281 RepID=A0A9N9ZMG2_9HYPO|nr:unnamed protein product [Clonostachys solani]
MYSDYCDRCDRQFNSESALDQHIRDSPRHHVCYACDDDFGDRDDLERHCEDCHFYCRDCGRFFDSAEDLEQHDILQHDMCITCGRYFSSESNLKNHQLTHMEKSIDCPGCERYFITYFAMLLHLETGTCSSGVNRERITELAFECRQSQYYASSKDDFDFECPDCAAPFSYISGLFQHVQSEACDEELDKQSPLRVFLRFLSRRV